jgi:anthranilate phosphoribosyltransferase
MAETPNPQYIMSLLPFIGRIVEYQDLNAEEAEAAMRVILEGRASHPQIAAFLTAMRMKGPVVAEMVGLARAMRQMAAKVEPDLPPGQALLDTCGTGGDGAGTFNISTLAAFVAAGAGVHVAKHGNRSISNSAAGSADLLEALGIEIALPPAATARAIREVGIGFLFAPAVHTAMRHAHPVRADLKLRTVFNLLGPLTNPAGADAQLVGAPDAGAAELLAGALAALGLRRGFVVHGSDGLDEITTTGPTLAFEILGGAFARRTLEPGDFGVPVATPGQLKGGDAARNLEIAKAVLGGAAGAARDIVVANTSAALVAAGVAASWLEGAAMAARSIDSGAAWSRVEALAAFSRAAGVSGKP